MVFLQSPLQGLQHQLPVFRVAHVDEVNDDDAAKVTQTQLPGDGLRRFQVRLEDSFLQVAPANKSPGVHINGGHGLGLVENQIPAGLQRHFALQSEFDLLLHPVNFKQRPITRIMFDQGQGFRHKFLGEFVQAHKRLAGIDPDFFHQIAPQIAQHPHR